MAGQRLGSMIVLTNQHMRVKTSITLPQELLERAAESYLRDLARQKRDARDIRILEKNAERLNREAEDVVDYQKIW